MSGVSADTVATLASGNAEIDALLWDRHWSRNNLTFSFPTGTAEYAYGAQNFGALLAQQQTAVNEVLGWFSAVSNVSFAAPAAGAAANLRFARASATDRDVNGVFTTMDNPATVPVEVDERVGTAYGIPPSDTAPSAYNVREWGDMWFNANPAGGTNDMTDPRKGNYGYHTILHEIGHVMGFDHPHGDASIGNHFGNLAAAWDSMEFTVMTYRSYIGDVSAGYDNDPWDYAQSLMVLDIAAMQYVYGADFSTNSGATTYKWRPTTGNMEINGIAENAATAPDPAVAASNRIFRTIWDGGGEDTYDFSSYATSLAVDLRAGSTTDPAVGWTILDTSAAEAQRADLGDGNSARGNIANARLFNGDLRSLIENAIGGTGNDSIVGNNAANTLSGGVGADALFGNDGPDRLEGGAGGDILDGGSGIDQAQYTFASAGITADLLFYLINTGDAAGDTYDSIENLRGTNFNDILRGDDGDNGIGGWFGGGADTLVGRGGNDTLAGGDGNDLLQGDTGGDALDGGDGVDTASYASANSRVVADLQTFVNLGDALGDTYLAVENLTGSAYNDDLRGNEVANILSGGAGGDGFNGRGGLDMLIGGAGNDNFFLEDLSKTSQFAIFAYDTISEGVGAGIDTAVVTAFDNPDTFSSIETYTLGANIENGLIRGVIAFNLTGNALDNYLQGNSAFNVLTGGVGDDFYALTDLAQSQSGQFSLYAYDTVTEGAGAGIDTVLVTAVDNPDTVASSESYTLGANVENGTIAGTLAFNLVGNGLDNTLQGNSAFNVLSGGVGNDTYALTGLAQSQSNPFSLYAYDTVNEGAGAGIDTVVVTAVDNPDTVSSIESYTLDGTIENGTIVGTLGFNLTGNGLDNRLVGNGAANRLLGGAGDDRLDGGGGIDTASYGGAAAAVAVSLARAGAQNTLGAGVDTLSGIENLAGSAFADMLTGDGAANRLEGGDGNDNLNGAAGNDQLFGGNGDDGMRATTGADLFDGGAGMDGVNFATASSSVIFLDGSGTNAGGATGDTFAGIEIINGSESGPDFIVGDAASNRFNGNGGNDTLNGKAGIDQLEGGAGADRLVGGFGNDVLVGGADADRFVFVDAPAAGGIDRTGDFVHLQDDIEIDASAFGGGLMAGGAVRLVANASPSSAGVVGGVFLYDTDSGFLSFDADGQGAGAAAAFFRLQNLPALTAADFVVVA